MSTFHTDVKANGANLAGKLPPASNLAAKPDWKTQVDPEVLGWAKVITVPKQIERTYEALRISTESDNSAELERSLVAIKLIIENKLIRVPLDKLQLLNTVDKRCRKKLLLLFDQRAPDCQFFHSTLNATASNVDTLQKKLSEAYIAMK